MVRSKREKEVKMAITLKAARVNVGLTQIDAAKALGISPDTVRKYEQGETFPDVPMIRKIEALYRISYNDIDFSCAAK
jgi:transcriptional regulator with XRE-family HTH domain